MSLTLVEFACYKNDPPKFYLLDDKKFDDWVRGEPQEGYHIFRVIGCWEIEGLLYRDNIEEYNLFEKLPWWAA